MEVRMARVFTGRRFASIACAAILWFVGTPWNQSQQVSAQQQGQLYVSALDSGGAPVTDLEPGDITVLVDDIECKVVKMEQVSKPMKLTLMIDNGPANSNALANLRTAVKNFIEATPSDVPLEILTIAPQPRWLEKSTTDKEKLVKAVDRLSPDSGAGLFFDALVEAGNRVDKEKTKEKSETVPVFVMLASDVGRNSSAMDRDYARLQKQVVQYGITVHFIVLNSGGERVGSVAGALQTEVGLALTKLSRGRYEAIAAATRLTTLLPELAKQISESNLRQTHQYRITYQLPAGKDVKSVQRFSAGLSRLRLGVNPILSFDGHMPIGGTQ
jgi:hypothetical protein